MPNFPELLFASVLLISSTVTMTMSGTLPPQPQPPPSPSPTATLTWSSFSSSSSLPPQEDPQSLSPEQNSIDPSLLEKICHSNSDCPSTHCCTVGMMRYSRPTCREWGKPGDSCIPGNTVQNFTLSYPNSGGKEEEEEVTDSFRLLCPCGPDSQCDENSVSCIAA